MELSFVDSGACPLDELVRTHIVTIEHRRSIGRLDGGLITLLVERLPGSVKMRCDLRGAFGRYLTVRWPQNPAHEFAACDLSLL